MAPPSAEELALQKKAAEQFFAWVAQMQRDQALEIHEVHV
jgi:hypothetical protein